MVVGHDDIISATSNMVSPGFGDSIKWGEYMCHALYYRNLLLHPQNVLMIYGVLLLLSPIFYFS